MKKLYIFSVITYFIANNTINAQYSELDVTFSSNGKVSTAIGASVDDKGNAVVVQSDGKIVVAGNTFNGTSYDFSVLRYNTNGTLDNTFSTDGKVQTSIGSGDDFANSVTIDPANGDIIVAGSSTSGANVLFAVVRYTSAGALDNTFSSDGKLTTSINNDETVSSVAIQADGKIVVAGYTFNGTDYDFALARYFESGLIDSTFDADGIVVTDFSSSNDYGYAVQIQNDTKIVVAGNTDSGADNDFAMARYDTLGVLDITFDGDGMLLTDFGNDDNAYSLVIQADNKILVAGDSDNGSDIDFSVARYDINGSLDASFSGDGKVMNDFVNSDDYGKSIGLLLNGKIIVAGQTNLGANDVYSLMSLNNDGSLDTGFDFDGELFTSFYFTDFATSMDIANGKIVVAGMTDNGSDFDFAVSQYYGCSTSSSAFSVISCDSYTVPSGDSTYFVNGIYMDTITNVYGCDSIMTITVALNNSSTSIINATSCGNYVLNAQTFTSTGTYSQTIPNTVGCDSIISLNLTVNNISLAVTQDGGTLSANLSAVWYQWLDCNNSDAIIPGEYFIDFTPAIDGDYSVIMSTLTCSDTSACFSVDNVGFDENKLSRILSIYPNPTNGVVTISVNSPIENATLKLINMSGQVLQQSNNLSGSTFTLDISEQADGIYFVEISEGENIQRIKVVKN